MGRRKRNKEEKEEEEEMKESKELPLTMVFEFCVHRKQASITVLQPATALLAANSLELRNTLVHNLGTKLSITFWPLDN